MTECEVIQTPYSPNMTVMLSLPKQLARFVAKPFNEASELLRQAQHDERIG